MNVSDYFADLEAHEGVTQWLYCDRRGLVTIGIGNLVENVDACAALPLYDLAAPLTVQPPPEASEAAKRAAYCQIAGAYNKDASAHYYKPLTSVRLTMDAVRALVATRLQTEFYPCLLRLCPDFDSFSLPARRALMDMAYQYGDESKIKGMAGFPSMLAACNRGDWATAAVECHGDCSPARNEWRREMFLAAGADAPSS